MKSLVAVVLCLAFASAAYSQNWPSFRGKNGTGVSDGNIPPTTWDVEKSINVLWKTAIPGLGHSSPVVWGERVFITTAVSSAPSSQFVHGPTQSAASADDTSKQSFRVYCLDKNTGRIVWQKTIPEGASREGLCKSWHDHVVAQARYGSTKAVGYCDGVRSSLKPALQKSIDQIMKTRQSSP